MLRKLNSASEGQLRDGRSRIVINVGLEEGIEAGKDESGIEGRNDLIETGSPSGGHELDLITTIDATDTVSL